MPKFNHPYLKVGKILKTTIKTILQFLKKKKLQTPNQNLYTQG